VQAFLHGHTLPLLVLTPQHCAPQNSNLVLTAETRTRDAAEPSGEPDSLWGRMKGKMGDRVHYNQPEELVDRKAKAKKKCVVLAGRRHLSIGPALLCFGRALAAHSALRSVTIARVRLHLQFRSKLAAMRTRRTFTCPTRRRPRH